MDKWSIPWIGEVEPLALWGAAVSTALAAIKLYEFWRDRSRLTASATLRGEPQIGNEIRVFNLSSKPIIVEHWEVFYSGDAWWFGKEEPATTTWEHACYFTVSPHGSYTLEFRDAEFFGWGAKLLAFKSIWIRIHVAGKRRPKLVRLYPRRDWMEYQLHRVKATFHLLFRRNR